MQLKDVMQRKLESVAPNTPLREAAQKMNTLGVRMLPVCEGDKIIGTLTFRDLTMRATAQGRDPVASKVREVMTREVVSCLETQDARRAAGIMRRRRIGQMFVLDRKKHLTGVVSLEDLQRNRSRQSRQGARRC